MPCGEQIGDAEMKVRAGMISLGIMAIAITTSAVGGPGRAPQKKAEPSPAPLPSQIGTAKKVFVSNAGGECSPFGQNGFSGGPDRFYNEFYAGIKSWGRFELVGAPADADLVLEIHFVCPIYVADKSSTYDPQFRLNILDPKTHITLWALTEHLPRALLKGNRDKDFDQAMASLVDGLKKVGDKPAAIASRLKN